MPEYRLYFVEENNRIAQPAKILDCADDEDATDRAMDFIDGRDIELWQKDRLVVRLPRMKP